VRRILFLLGVLVTLVAPAAAWAHPLGNFTVNRYSRIEPSGGRVYVLYVLDMAEIPTFQERPAIEAEREGPYARRMASRIARRVELTVEGERVPLRPLRHALAFPPGQAGLRTMRLEIVLASKPLERGRPARLVYRDTNFEGRIGWREIVVRAGPGARVSSASVPGETISGELRVYPQDLLRSPLEIREASAEIVPGSGPGVAPALRSRTALEERVGVRAVSDGGFAKLIARDDLSVGFVLVSLAIALFWGAAHAFSPGHGKAIIAAYLVGSRGTPRHALLLGLTVTVTHTIGVFALGLVTLSLSEFILPEQLYPWLNLVSALLIVAVGASVLRWRLREWRDGKAHDHHHGHAHEHGCGCHGHDRADSALSRRRLLGVGISGGIIPCPTALVVLLAAISLHRVGYGLVLIVAFSIGLAAAMSGIGLLAITAKRLFTRVDFENGLLRLLPAFSALLVLGLGIAMTVRAVPNLT